MAPSESLDGDVRHMPAADGMDVDLFEPSRPPSRRRARRSGAVTYRVHVDLVGTRPPLWRRLELASDLFLDDVHEIVQVAFGWTDSHLHRFGSGSAYYSRDTEYYLCPFDVEEGDAGIPEERVRLDEVLVEAGDKLFYNYDYGDDWQHTIRLEAVLAREDSAPRVVCTAGRRPGPAEDCGGIGGYELLVAATDATHPEHIEALAEYGRFFGPDADPAYYKPIPFEIDDINHALADFGVAGAAPPAELPEQLDELVHAVRTASGKRLLVRLIGDAGLDQPVQIDADTAARMVRPYTWLLDRVGTDGITLTDAGYLPPAHVEAAVAQLNLAKEWIGKGNREIQTVPVLKLRESAQQAGLLRKQRGRLLLTTRGHALRADPTGLWSLLAEKSPPRSADVCETQAGLLLLLTVAAQFTGDRHAIVAELLGAIGWLTGDGGPLTGLTASQAGWDTTATLRRLGAFADDGGGRELPTVAGITFARAALTTW